LHERRVWLQALQGPERHLRLDPAADRVQHKRRESNEHESARCPSLPTGPPHRNDVGRGKAGPDMYAFHVRLWCLVVWTRIEVRARRCEGALFARRPEIAHLVRGLPTRPRAVRRARVAWRGGISVRPGVCVRSSYSVFSLYEVHVGPIPFQWRLAAPAERPRAPSTAPPGPPARRSPAGPAPGGSARAPRRRARIRDGYANFRSRQAYGGARHRAENDSWCPSGVRWEPISKPHAIPIKIGRR